MRSCRRGLLLCLACLPAAGLAQEQGKFSLSMFHFNLQYVAGGLEGFPSGDDPNPAFALDNDQVEDLIITQSFEPVLDLFLAHRDWKVTLEMQGLMVEVLSDRHPMVLRKLKQLADNGQAEIVSFHWSDQLFLAYPRRDLEASHELMEPVWREVGLQPSPVVFCQEGQFGEGMIAFGRPRGRTIFVLAKNHFRYQHAGSLDAAPALFQKDGADVVLGSRGFALPEVEVRWSFFDDGELLATNGSNPYMGTGFVHRPEAVAAYEAELEAQAAEGFRIATIQEYVAFVKASGLPRPDLPPVLDGTWQPPSTDSMHRWMGAAGLLDLVYGDERDNQVLTGNVLARHWIRAAETLVQHAEAQGLVAAGAYAAALDACWREALLGQVSDATGINPFEGEVRYGLAQAERASACAGAVLDELAPRVGGPVVVVEPALGRVEVIDDIPAVLVAPAEEVFRATDGFRVDAPGREVVLAWERVGLAEGLTRLTVTAGPPAAGERRLRVTFPLRLSGFYLTPGLTELQAVFYPFGAFDFLDGRITLPLANGLLGLADDLWLVKQTSQVHIGATFPIGLGQVFFEDQTLDPAREARWVFWLLRGDATDAVALADRLNLNPPAYLETGVSSGRGCGCGAGEGPGGLLGALLSLGALVLLGARRR
jgi:hypothetical protein